MSGQPGRPRRFDEEQALDALLFLFWRQGYDNTSQQDMAEAAGISTSSLFNTFGSKAQVFDRILERYTEMAAQGCQGLVVGTDPLGALHAWVDDLAQHTSGDGPAPDGCLMTMSMNELAGREPDIALRAQLWRDLFHRSLSDAVTRAQEAGDLNDDQPIAVRASTLQAMQLGALSIARSAVSPKEVAPVIEGMHAVIESWR